MDINLLFNLLQPTLLVKLFLLVLAFFYFIFTLVVSRQITLMTQILNSSLAPVVKIVALLQILAAAILFFLVAVLA